MKKIRSPSVARSSDRFKLKITNQTNQYSCSKFTGRDDWTPDVRGGGKVRGMVIHVADLCSLSKI